MDKEYGSSVDKISSTLKDIVIFHIWELTYKAISSPHSYRHVSASFLGLSHNLPTVLSNGSI